MVHEVSSVSSSGLCCLCDQDINLPLLQSPRPNICRYAVPEPYEKLKAFTRGQAVTQASMQVIGLQ